MNPDRSKWIELRIFRRQARFCSCLFISFKVLVTALFTPPLQSHFRFLQFSSAFAFTLHVFKNGGLKCSGKQCQHIVIILLHVRTCKSQRHIHKNVSYLS